MKQLEMRNGEVVDAESETVPWCPVCRAFAVPTDDGECGECGTSVVFK